MGDFFANLRSGIEFPQVVMNQGPMPGTGGLPRPLHDTVDGRINYNSSLLGDLSPYAYGEPGYLSSQTSYLNIPHKLQKIVPAVFLPVAVMGTHEFFDLSHPVDDGDLAFTLRMDRNSLFCTGVKVGGPRRSPLGTAIDPLVNLATVNYILSGFQLSTGSRLNGGLWNEFFYNVDNRRFNWGSTGSNTRSDNPNLDDVIHLVRHCIRPFGIVRGSEKQGGQNEATASPATWPVNFVASVTLDGKESNVMNLWHHLDFSAGEDLVLRLKLMPIRPYTLNHYYKGVKRQSWGSFFQLASSFHGDSAEHSDLHIWQLVPDIMHLQPPTPEELGRAEKAYNSFVDKSSRSSSGIEPLLMRKIHGRKVEYTPETPWQDLGYWHIGRSQIMSRKYGTEEYWHNDNANDLRTNHLDLTLQPTCVTIPSKRGSYRDRAAGYTFARLQEEERARKRLAPSASFVMPEWKPTLALERLPVPSAFVMPPPVQQQEERWDQGLGLPPAAQKKPVEEEDIGTLSFTFDAEPPPPQPVVVTASKAGTKGRGKKGALAGGSLLRADGTSEPSVVVGML